MEGKNVKKDRKIQNSFKKRYYTQKNNNTFLEDFR